MDKTDRILVAIYRNAERTDHPEHCPVEAGKVSEAARLELPELMAICPALMDCHLIEVAKQRNQPVLCLTKYGASRARLLASAYGIVQAR